MTKTKQSSNPFKLNTITYLLIAAVLVIGFFFGAQYKQSNSQFSEKSKRVNDKYISYVSPTPAQISDESNEVTNEIQSVGLVSTEGWKDATFDDISFKVPVQSEAILHNYPETCQDGFDKCYRIKNHDSNDQFQGIEIAIKPYSGGSRRTEAGWEGVFEYKNIKVGDYDALEATFICQIDACTPFRRVLIVLGNRLVSIQDSTYLDKNNGGDGTETNPWSASLESPITNTIISTIK